MNPTQYVRHGSFGTLLMGCLLAQGCMSPTALDHAVMAYDQTTTDILSKQLLLNIARAHQHQPLHFTGVSNIAATFNFQFNAGATPAMTGEAGGLITPILGGTVSENPTISIVPIEGEEFTSRLLAPFQESKLTMLLRQGADVDTVLRLLVGEWRTELNGLGKVYNNKPSDTEGYRQFRQVVAHLSSIQDRHALYVEPLWLERSWQLSRQSLTPEQLIALQQNFKVDYNLHTQQLTLSKHVSGHIILTNYDPQRLSNEERIRLNEEADNSASNDVMVDVRAGYPGGELPIHGVFRLRSFYNVLNFIGQDIEAEPEYPVEKHPQTPEIRENPVHTLQVSVTAQQPDNAELSVAYGDYYYAIQPETGYQWNRESFRLLYQIFQMTVTNLKQEGAPGITIAK